MDQVLGVAFAMVTYHCLELRPAKLWQPRRREPHCHCHLSRNIFRPETTPGHKSVVNEQQFWQAEQSVLSLQTCSAEKWLPTTQLNNNAGRQHRRQRVNPHTQL